MDYTNSQMKLDQLIGYFNEKKINLIPPFQRGHVWKLSARKRLMQNIVAGRPIPAIFLYKEPDGSKYTYNILDGKQRLESLLLFIGSRRTDVKIDAVKSYFYNRSSHLTDLICIWIALDVRDCGVFRILPPDSTDRLNSSVAVLVIGVFSDARDATCHSFSPLIVDWA